CLQTLAETTIDMLIATRGVIAKNQELINRDPTTGNYYVKGFVPAVAGSQVANDFSLMTGHKLKQTSLKIRNPSNAPDEWEKKVLKSMETPEYSHGKGFGETMKENGNMIYRYMKPIYVEIACLQCHGNEEKVKPAIRLFLKRKYPLDEAFGYKEGELRGGISLTISFKNLGIKK
ncbi:MAG: Tll0287-like domain-containing protein, partial [Planctomycetota bacterium]